MPPIPHPITHSLQGDSDPGGEVTAENSHWKRLYFKELSFKRFCISYWL